MNDPKLCTRAQCERLKILGFDWECQQAYTHYPDVISGDFRCHNYNNELKYGIWCSAPHLEEARAWLRKVKKWEITPMLNGVRTMYFVRVLEIKGNGVVLEPPGQFDEYEDALSAGIDSILSHLISQNWILEGKQR